MSKEVLLKPSNLDLLTRNTDSIVQIKKEKADNPRLGILYFSLSGFVFCINFMFGKVLYENHAELGAN